MILCIVVNKNRINMDDPDVVYIWRGSIWGNPYSHKEGTKAIFKVDTVAEAIAQYRQHLWRQIKAGEVTIEMLKGLDGKRLACYCAPNPCHGNVIRQSVKWAKELDSEKLRRGNVLHNSLEELDKLEGEQ
ncbi:hypothetical protein D3C80_774550 [compost metagenome]